MAARQCLRQAWPWLRRVLAAEPVTPALARLPPAWRAPLLLRLCGRGCGLIPTSLRRAVGALLAQDLLPRGGPAETPGFGPGAAAAADLLGRSLASESPEARERARSALGYIVSAAGERKGQAPGRTLQGLGGGGAGEDADVGSGSDVAWLGALAALEPGGGLLAALVPNLAGAMARDGDPAVLAAYLRCLAGAAPDLAALALAGLLQRRPLTARALLGARLGTGAAADALDVLLAALRAAPAAAEAPEDHDTVWLAPLGATAGTMGVVAPLDVARAAPLALAAVAGVLMGSGSAGEAGMGRSSRPAADAPGAASGGRPAEPPDGRDDMLKQRYERLVALLLRPRTDAASTQSAGTGDWVAAGVLRRRGSGPNPMPETLPLLEEQGAAAAARCPDARLASAGMRALSPAGASRHRNAQWRDPQLQVVSTADFLLCLCGGHE